ncbi:hypothetical protein QBC39DRAFT_374313 [Podospora conica]|nr:hypothetical protein QBC39DRAFT_374313 [Schizothecium conicum]
MCINNSALFLCGTSVQEYGKKPKAAIRWCLQIRTTILLFVVQHNILPPVLDTAEFDTALLPRLRTLCHLEHGPDFAAVVHRRFAGTVADYVKRWGGKRQLWLLGPDGGYTWNPTVVDEHFQSLSTVEAWLRSQGVLNPWERATLDPVGALSGQQHGSDASVDAALALSLDKGLNLANDSTVIPDDVEAKALREREKGALTNKPRPDKRARRNATRRRRLARAQSRVQPVGAGRSTTTTTTTKNDIARHGTIRRRHEHEPRLVLEHMQLDRVQQ